MFAAALSMCAACSQDDEPALTHSSFAITVADQGYNLAESASSRTIEEGYVTKFVAEDACGLFVVRNNQVILSNVKLTAASAGNEALVWRCNEELSHREGDRYYLYYPWKETATGMPAKEAAAEADFFAAMATAWQPAVDQTEYASYTASDLMVDEADVQVVDEKVSLTFGMTHSMALAVVKLPVTGTEEASGQPVSGFRGTAQPYLDDLGLYRYLMNPASAATLDGYYYKEGKERVFTIDIPAGKLQVGTYMKYVVDGDASDLKEISISSTITDWDMDDNGDVNADVNIPVS